MGEVESWCFQLSLNASLRGVFQDSRVTSDSGLILVHELDERLAFVELIAEHLTDSRGKNVQLGLGDLLRQKVLRNGANPGFLIPTKVRPDTTGALAPGRNTNERLRVEISWGKFVRNPKGKRKSQVTIHIAIKVSLCQ
jgi:hypothetical protein